MVDAILLCFGNLLEDSLTLVAQPRRQLAEHGESILGGIRVCVRGRLLLLVGRGEKVLVYFIERLTLLFSRLHP